MRLFLGSILTLCLVLTGCGGSGSGDSGSSGNPAPQKVALSSIAIQTEGPLEIPVGYERKLTAEATFSDGSTKDITSLAAWTSGNSEILEVVAEGHLMARVPGDTQVLISYQEKTAEVDVRVTDAVLESLILSEDAIELPAGVEGKLQARATFSDGTTRDVTAEGDWVSQDTAVVEVSRGTLQPRNPGTAQVSVTYHGATAAANVEVTAAILQALFIPAPEESTTLPSGRTLRLEAKGSFSDGSSQNLSTWAAWSSSNPEVATVEGGTITTHSLGETQISAAFEGFDDSVALTVTAAAVDSLQIALTPLELPLGTRAPMAVTALYSDGTEADVTAEATITPEDSSIVAVVTGTEGKQLEARALGTSPVAAEWMGVRSEALQVTVTDAILVALSIPSGDQTIHPGLSRQLNAAGTYSDGTTQPLTRSVTWISDAPEVASVDENGLLRAGLPGTAALQVEQKDLASPPVQVRVFNSTLGRMRVQPVNSYNPLDFDFPYTVSCEFINHDEDRAGEIDRLDVTELADWTSSHPEIVSVGNAAGEKGAVHTGTQAGTSVITTTWAGVSDATVVHVEPLDYELGMNRDDLSVPDYAPSETTFWRQYPLPEICDGVWCRERATADATRSEVLHRQYKIKVNAGSAPITITNLQAGTDSDVDAWFEGLSEGQQIAAGEEVIVSLLTTAPAVGQTTLAQWSLNIVEQDGSQLDPVGPEFQMSLYVTGK